MLRMLETCPAQTALLCECSTVRLFSQEPQVSKTSFTSTSTLLLCVFCICVNWTHSLLPYVHSLSLNTKHYKGHAVTQLVLYPRIFMIHEHCQYRLNQPFITFAPRPQDINAMTSWDINSKNNLARRVPAFRDLHVYPLSVIHNSSSFNGGTVGDLCVRVQLDSLASSSFKSSSVMYRLDGLWVFIFIWLSEPAHWVVM